MATDVTTILNSHLVRELTQETLDNVKLRIISNMSAKRRNASMRSVRSLTVKVDGTGGTLYGLSSFLAMETGRKGGKVPRDFRRIIADWVVAKGISIYTNTGRRPRVSSVAYLIARKIKTQGTALHREGRFEDIYTRASNEETLKLSEKIRLLVSSGVDYLHKDFANND